MSRTASVERRTCLLRPLHPSDEGAADSISVAKPRLGNADQRSQGVIDRLFVWEVGRDVRGKQDEICPRFAAFGMLAPHAALQF